MKFGRFHEIWQISCADFTKSGRFHVQISHADFMWNPPTNLINQIIQEKLFSFMECCEEGYVMFSHEIQQISWNPPNFMWNLADFERPIARNGNPYVLNFCVMSWSISIENSNHSNHSYIWLKYHIKMKICLKFLYFDYFRNIVDWLGQEQFPGPFGCMDSISKPISV